MGGHIRKNNKLTQQHGQRITTLERINELRRAALLGIYARSTRAPQHDHTNMGGLRVRPAQQGQRVLLGRGRTDCFED